jgi:hypothetical protein
VGKGFAKGEAERMVTTNAPHFCTAVIIDHSSSQSDEGGYARQAKETVAAGSLTP